MHLEQGCQSLRPERANYAAAMLGGGRAGGVGFGPPSGLSGYQVRDHAWAHRSRCLKDLVPMPHQRVQ